MRRVMHSTTAMDGAADGAHVEERPATRLDSPSVCVSMNAKRALDALASPPVCDLATTAHTTAALLESMMPPQTRITHSQSLGDPKSEPLVGLENLDAEGSVHPHHHRRATTGQLMQEEAPKDRIDIIADYLKGSTSIRPLIGIVCGSGLGGLSKCLTKTDTIKYEDIPLFPRSTVEGHAGELVFGWLDEYPVVCMRGRFHSYEGYEMRETALPIRIMYMLGIKYLIVTNAAGALNPDYNVGDIMVMNDHLNMPGLAGKHPLVGPNDARFGQRFTPLSECYDRKLQNIAYKTADRLQLNHRVRQKGVYCFVSGPTYETPTECRLLRLVGGDAVGMSTVPEVIVAVHCGVKVVGLSLITNKVIYPGQEGLAASHEEVLEATQLAQRDIETYVREIIWEIGQQHNC